MKNDIKNNTPLETNIRIIISSNIRRLRTIKGLTQEQLAERSGVHRTVIVRYESATRTMKLENLLKIANGLNVTPNDLLAGWNYLF